MKDKIIIGSRGSSLALWQANYVKSRIEKLNNNAVVEIKIVKTTGDKILGSPLSTIGDKGLFTKELENELLNNTIDLAVHSLKDIQTKIPAGLKLSAVTERYPNEDVLISKEKNTSIKALRKKAVIATGSLRRKSQLLNLRPDLKIEELRGNVPTRIEKFLNSNWDAIILARAGVERLGLEKHISSIISKEEILPAVGQGALGIEINEKNEELNDLLRLLHHEKTYKKIRAERALLGELEGGCQVPIGADAEINSGKLTLHAYVGSVDGKIAFRKNMTGNEDEPEEIGVQLAHQLVNLGAKEILEEIFQNFRKESADE